MSSKSVEKDEITSNIVNEVNSGEQDGPSKAQVSFATRLASNGLPERTKAIESLTRYFKNEKNQWTELDCMKIWKGLFYAMWMADGVFVQEDLAEQMAKLLHIHSNTERALLFLKAFFITMDNEWQRIDVLRMDKYYSLIRKFVRQIFVYIKEHSYDKEVIASTFGTLLDTVFSPNAEFNINHHICDIYLEELHKVVGEDNLPSDVMDLFITELFIPALVKTRQPGLRNKILEVFAAVEAAALNYEIEDELAMHNFSLKNLSEKLFEVASSRNEILYRKALYTWQVRFEQKARNQQRLQDAAASMPKDDEDEDDEITKQAKAILAEEEAKGLFNVPPKKKSKSKKRAAKRKRQQEAAQDETTEAVNENGSNNVEEVNENGSNNGEEADSTQGPKKKKQKRKKAKKNAPAHTTTTTTTTTSEEPAAEEDTGVSVEDNSASSVTKNKKKQKQKKVKQENGHHIQENGHVQEENNGESEVIMEITTTSAPVLKKRRKAEGKTKQAAPLPVAVMSVVDEAQDEHNNNNASNNSNNTNGVVKPKKKHHVKKEATSEEPEQQDNSSSSSILTTPPPRRKKSLLKTPDSVSVRKNVRFSEEDYVKEFYKDSFPVTPVTKKMAK